MEFVAMLMQERAESGGKQDALEGGEELNRIVSDNAHSSRRLGKRLEDDAVGRRKEDARVVQLLGPATAAPVAQLLSKWLLVSCVDTEQADLACSAVDCGYLVSVGALSSVVVSDKSRALDALIEPLMQMGFGQILLETAYNGAILPMQKPGTKCRISADMLVHHAAALCASAFLASCTVGSDGIGRQFMLQGCRLAATELTTCLPICYHEARQSGRLTGWRSIAIGATMAGAFAWRTLYSVDILRQFEAAVRDRRAGGGEGTVPRAWMGRVGLVTIAGSNAMWTARIFRGLFRRVLGRR